MTQKKTKPSANVIDGKLILSLPGAVNPVLWQMDLNDAKASALEIQDDEKGVLQHLRLKTPRGEVMTVASFDTNEDALHALMLVSKALEKAHGQIKPAAAATDQGLQVAPSGKKGNNIVGAGLAVLFLIILIGVWNMMAAGPQTYQTSMQTSGTASAEQSVGVPVSADDFLRGQ